MSQNELRRFLLSEAPGRTVPELLILGRNAGASEGAVSQALVQLMKDRILVMNQASTFRAAPVR